MSKGTKYLLKTGETIEAIEVGKANIVIGNKNNRLTICDRAPNTKSRKARIICQCDCGKYTVINFQDFTSGKVKSCGCYSSEQKAERCKQRTIDFSSSERNINPFYIYIKPTNERKYE